jgi:hypothetical protein
MTAVLDSEEEMVSEGAPATQPSLDRDPTNPLFGAPPHVPCHRCGHMACKHYGYPGRGSDVRHCIALTFPTFTPVRPGIPQVCTCTVTAGEIV